MVSGLLAMVVFGAYLLLFAVVSEMRHSVKGTDRPEAALASVERIEDIISDLETGVIGFAITHDPAALRPWNTERDDLRAAETRLERLAASTGQRRSGEARRIVEDSETCLRRYLGPLVDGLQRNADSSRVLGMIGGMERQITVLQSEIDRFESDEHGLVEHYEDRTGAYTHRAKIITIAGASWTVLMILFCSPTSPARSCARSAAPPTWPTTSPRAVSAYACPRRHPTNWARSNARSTRWRQR